MKIKGSKKLRFILIMLGVCFIHAANAQNKVVDTATYRMDLQLYHQGRSDFSFLEKLALQAKAARDFPAGRQVISTYIGKLKKPYTEEHIKTVQLFMITPDGPSYHFFIKNRNYIAKLMGDKYVHDQLWNAIWIGKIQRYVPDKTAKPDWKQAEKDIRPYGNIGREVYLGRRAQHHYVQRDMESLLKIGSEFFESYPNNQDDYNLNNWAWELFKTSNDSKVLETALKWSKKSVDMLNHDPNAGDLHINMDTYANLLYKLGKKKEAVAAEQQAIEIAKAKNEQNYVSEFQNNLVKMQNGEPTWPVSVITGEKRVL